MKYVQIATPSVGPEELAALVESLESGWLTQGPKVKAFEEAFAARHQSPHALAVTSCTTALHLAMLALGIGPGDRVVVPSFTWVATANAAEYCGATPVFCDSDPETYNIAPAAFRRLVEEMAGRGQKPKAMVAVHLFGLMAGMDEIMATAGEFGLKVIEDAACAAGAALNGRPAGTFGDIGCFSFHPRKTITTGEGGMLLTADGQLAEKLARLRSHGASLSEEARHHGARPWMLPEFNEVGYNYRMSDLQGAVGLAQIGRLDGFIEERRHWAAWYGRELAGLPWLKLPEAPAGFEHSWQAYVAVVDEKLSPLGRDEIMEAMEKAGLASRPGTHAIHMLGYYRNKYGPQNLPQAGRLYRQSLTLPLHNRMAEEDYRRVADCLKGL
ncbi:perosamine synthetase (plasmid) [Deltaproteobacteria bacterium Smac51]|nr:perosamine synthetase [Deltaproteobacteria bacterium Smac51]